MSAIHDLTMNDINGNAVALSTYADQVNLIVNVASR